MSSSDKQRLYPPPGLSMGEFACIGKNGFGDPLNAYPHAMVWYKDRLFVGTTRSNLCMLKVSKIKTNLEHWPVQCPDNLYELDMRAQIWRYERASGTWDEVYRSPMIDGTDGTPVPSDMGYRCITEFQGRSDSEPTLYVGTYASAKGQGTRLLRTTDGETYDQLPLPDEFGGFVTSIRLLVPFKGRLFTSPTGRAQGNPNAAFLAVVFETDDPVEGKWTPVSERGFGDPGNISVFELAAFGDHLYAGTANMDGYQVWRTRAEGKPPYRWERIIEQGAYRGKLNQGVASLCAFKDALYVGSGIQHGGIDIVNKVGPAGPELVRIHPDGDWDLIVGNSRDTPIGRKDALSGFSGGFDNFFNGYFWRMGSHDGWLYLGTFDWSLMLQFSKREKWPPLLRDAIQHLGTDAIFRGMAGADVYRSYDGENWVPVTTNGFDNPYNYGVRTIVSTPIGLAVGTVNPFGPKVARFIDDKWEYADNPHGGLEIWLGTGSAGTEPQGGSP